MCVELLTGLARLVPFTGAFHMNSVSGTVACYTSLFRKVTKGISRWAALEETTPINSVAMFVDVILMGDVINASTQDKKDQRSPMYTMIAAAVEALVLSFDGRLDMMPPHMGFSWPCEMPPEEACPKAFEAACTLITTLPRLFHNEGFLLRPAIGIAYGQIDAARSWYPRELPLLFRAEGDCPIASAWINEKCQRGSPPTTHTPFSGKLC